MIEHRYMICSKLLGLCCILMLSKAGFAEMKKESGINEIVERSAEVFIGKLESKSKAFFSGSGQIQAKFTVEHWLKGGGVKKVSLKKKVKVDCYGHCLLRKDQLYLVAIYDYRMNSLPAAIIPIAPDDELIDEAKNAIKQQGERLPSREASGESLIVLLRRMANDRFPNAEEIWVYGIPPDDHFERVWQQTDIHDPKDKKSRQVSFHKGAKLGKKTSPYVEIIEMGEKNGAIFWKGKTSDQKTFDALLNSGEEVQVKIE